MNQTLKEKKTQIRKLRKKAIKLQNSSARKISITEALEEVKKSA